MSTCPYCAEALPASAERCPSCGEDPRGPAPAQAPGGRGPGFVIGLIVLVLLGAPCLLGLLAALLMPALMQAKDKANRTKCGNDLRQLGLASLQYADDKRRFPHVRGLDELDGAVETGDGSRVARTLLWAGYLDTTEPFVCPSSFDLAAPLAGDPRAFGWAGAVKRSTSVSPIADELDDPPTDLNGELSYGWQRRALTANARSTTPWSADKARRDPMNLRAVGNHEGGTNVITADCAVSWRAVGAEGPLASTDPADPQAGFLGIVEPGP